MPFVLAPSKKITAQDVSLFADGQLPPEKEELVRSAINESPELKNLLISMEETKVLLHALTEEASPLSMDERVFEVTRLEPLPALTWYQPALNWADAPLAFSFKISFLVLSASFFMML